MSEYRSVFERYEKKYIISFSQKERLLARISDILLPDEFGESTLCNLYFDTPDYRLIRASIERPVFKEKLRIRSYGVPDKSSNVFVELKKKYKGVVYKRRINMTYEEAVDLLCRRNLPLSKGQVLGEVAYFMGHYKGLRPSVSIFCERSAFYSAEDENLRLTFDRNVRFRNQLLDLSLGDDGTRILEDGLFIMEIKSLNSIPLSIVHTLNELEIYPRSFSKYGKAYEMIFSPEPAAVR